MKTVIVITYDNKVDDGRINELVGDIDSMCGEDQSGASWAKGEHTVEVADEQKEQQLAELLQEFVDISSFDKSDPSRSKLPALKAKAKKLLGNQ